MNAATSPTVTPGDVIAAGFPVVSTLTLGDLNTAVSIFVGLLGAAYLARKWYREETAKKPRPPEFDI